MGDLPCCRFLALTFSGGPFFFICVNLAGDEASLREDLLGESLF